MTDSGFKNFETRTVVEWMQNDPSEAPYREARSLCASLDEDDDRASRVSALAARLKDGVYEARPELDSPFAELINGALSVVDWHEVADVFMEDDDDS